MRRGAIAFWIKQNNNNPVSGPTEIFNTYPGTPYIAAGFTPSLSEAVTAVVNGTATTLTIPNHGLATGALIQVSGATGSWSSLNAAWTVTVVDSNDVTIPLNSSSLGTFSGTAAVLTAGSVSVNHFGTSAATWSYGTYKTDSFFMPAGQWHQVIWSWTDDFHKVYRDGVLVASYNSQSPFPYTATYTIFSIGTQAGGTQDISVDEFSSYDFDLTPQEAAALYAATSPAPATRMSTHGITAVAVWGPGQQTVKVTLDAGDYGAQVTKFHANVLQGGTVVASQDFTQPNNGFAEGVITLPSFPSGTYSVAATAFNSTGSVVGTATSASYAFTQPSWLGNTLGIDNSVPAPYFTPITTSANDNLSLNVVNRTYTLDGGFGLPSQITSLGQAQLSTPVTLSINQNGQSLPFTNTKVSMGTVQPNQANWTGSAVAGGSVAVSVSGSLAYDGMMLLTLQLSPVSGPVSLSGIKLQTNLTSAASKYVFAVKDQPYWWYVWSVRTPTAVGVFNNNLSAEPTAGKTNNIFSVVFSDDDRGLEIFHNNMAGWQINESSPWQQFIRNSDGTVTYECDLANQAFTLSQPISITLGYMSTPVKYLPPAWRLAVGGAYGGNQAPTSNLQYQFDFTLGYTWNSFSLYPVTPSSYLAGATTPIRAGGKLDLPFVNAHVLVPTSPATWTDMNTIGAETLNDGWNSSPTRGEADYWAWSMNYLLNGPPTANVVDGYYIDESYAFLSNASLLTGAGYIKPDGTHGVGLNLLAARNTFTRLAKLLIAAGKTPNLWMHTTAFSAPHMYSHAMMTFDGERPISGTNYYVDTTTPTPNPDFFSTWNNNNSMLNTSAIGSGSWLLGTAQTRKFGFIPNMWRGINSGTYYNNMERQASCLYQMADILQQDQSLSWWQTKANFGIDQSDVTFHGFTTQNAILASDPNVMVTYYQRTNSLLAYVANFNSTNWTGTLNVASLPSSLTSTVIDAESLAPLPLSGTTLPLSVNTHDCRVVQFGQ